jgi:hypothetical protein
VKDNRFIDAVQKLRPEVVFELAPKEYELGRYRVGQVSVGWRQRAIFRNVQRRTFKVLGL